MGKDVIQMIVIIMYNLERSKYQPLLRSGCYVSHMLKDLVIGGTQERIPVTNYAFRFFIPEIRWL